MNLDAGRAQIPRSRRLPWLEITLIAGFVFFVLLGIISLAAFFLLRTDTNDDVAGSPTTTFDSAAVVPQLALMQLAGDPAGALAYQAAAAGELDVAGTIALYTAELSGPQRLALLLHLGERLLEAERSDQAEALFGQALSVAILDTELTTQERGQALVHIASAYAELGLTDSARDAAQQAVRVAVQAPGLLPIQRSRIFESLKPAMQRLDDPNFTAQLNELARNPFMDATGAELAPLWIPSAEPPPPDASVQATTAARLQAARQLTQRLLATGGVDIEPERQALAAALLAEDQARSDAYRTALSAGLGLPEQLHVLLDYRAWIATKLRIALGGFGMSLVPEWEQNATTLSQELSTLSASAKPLFDAQAKSLADPVQEGMLQTEGLRWLALQSMLGYFDAGDPAGLGEQLRFFQSELARLNTPLALPIAYEAGINPPGFRFQPFP